jgi:autotransporter adhesin
MNKTYRSVWCVKTHNALGKLNTNVVNVTNTVNNITNGGGIKYFHTNSALGDSSATGTNSTAIGLVPTVAKLLSHWAPTGT